MNNKSFLPVGQVMLIPKGKLYFQRSPLFEKNTSLRDGYLKSAPLTAEYASHLFDKDLQLVIAPEVSSLAELSAPYAYRTLLLSENAAGFPNPLSYEPSLYLTLIVPQELHEIGNALPTLTTYIETLHLTLTGPIFLSTMVGDQHLADRSTCRYFCKIEIAVKNGG